LKWDSQTGMNSRIIIYQLMPRLFTNNRRDPVHNGSILENGCGKFNDLTDRVIEELSEYGITHIWLTGILRHATTTDYPNNNLKSSSPDIVKGKAGSPFAVTDYYDVDPDLSISVPDRMDEFNSLLNRIHSHGLKVIIDFIPNHVSRDYRSVQKPQGVLDLGALDDPSVSFKRDNNFYYLPGQFLRIGNYSESPAKATGNDVFNSNPSVNDWYDTIKINYGIDFSDHTNHFDPIPDTWNKMKDILQFWVAKGIDGFRCDMAGMIPVEFWAYSIQRIKAQNPEIIFIAELYEPERYRDFLESGGFDFLYDKAGFYDILRPVITGQNSTQNISRIWQSLDGLDSKMLRFLENHDEQRIASNHFAGDSRKGLPGMALAALMNKGPLLLYSGQEVGEPATGSEGFSGDDGRTSIFDYTIMPEIQKWYAEGKCDGSFLSPEQNLLRGEYSSLIRLASQSPAKDGAFYDLKWANGDNPESDRTYAFIRYHPDAANVRGGNAGRCGNIIWLIVISFDWRIRDLNIRIPSHALEILGFTDDSRILISPLPGFPGETQNLLISQITTRGVKVELNQAGYIICQSFLPA